MAFDLASLLNGLDVPAAGTAPELKNIDISQLRADVKNFYSVTDESVTELAANIECVGLQQPLNVRPDPDEEGAYIVVSGHRRLAALQLLVSEGKKDFAAVPCMVVANGSEALNELRLIYGNANTRQLSNWELAKQAERVQELFYLLKEEGMEFPGRMRDHVAAACQVSKSKLSRLKVIGERLEIFLDEWRDGRLSEAGAYELAQCDPELQRRIRDAKVNPAKTDTAKIKRVREAWEAGARWEMGFICTPTGKPCGHGDVALRRDLAAEGWTELCRGETCCLLCKRGADCPSVYTPCDRMCKLAADKRKAKAAKDEAGRKQEDAKRRQREDEEFRVRIRPYVEAAKAAGLPDDVKLQLSYVSFTAADLAEAMEDPGKMSQRWVFNKPDGRDLAKVADQFGCSVDYLLGRTEVMAVAAEPLEDGPSWQVGEPERPGRYWCKIDFCDGFEPWVEDLRWTGERWKSINDDAVVLAWWPLPEG